MKATIMIAIRLAALTLLYFISFAAVSAALLPRLSEQPGPDQAGAAPVSLLIVSLLNTRVLGYVILRSRWTGWKLFVFYGVITVMPADRDCLLLDTSAAWYATATFPVRGDYRGTVFSAGGVSPWETKISRDRIEYTLTLDLSRGSAWLASATSSWASSNRGQ